MYRNCDRIIQANQIITRIAGEKGMIYAAKVMACYGVKLIEQPEIQRKAKEEFDRQMEGRTYKWPIPDEIGVPE